MKVSCFVMSPLVRCVIFTAFLWFGFSPIANANSEYPLPTELGNAITIVRGVNADLWFTLPLGGQIGRITTSGGVTYFQLPTGSDPQGIALALDGTVWFTAPVGYLDSSGTPVTFAASGDSITLGPDGNIWFAAFGEIGTISVTTHNITLFPISSGRFT